MSAGGKTPQIFLAYVISAGWVRFSGHTSLDFPDFDVATVSAVCERALRCLCLQILRKTRRKHRRKTRHIGPVRAPFNLLITIKGSKSIRKRKKTGCAGVYAAQPALSMVISTSLAYARRYEPIRRFSSTRSRAMFLESQSARCGMPSNLSPSFSSFASRDTFSNSPV